MPIKMPQWALALSALSALVAAAACGGRSELLPASSTDAGAGVPDTGATSDAGTGNPSDAAGSSDDGAAPGQPEAAPPCVPSTGLTTLATGALGSIAVDGANVYWTSYSSDTDEWAVSKISRCGGSVTTLASGAGPFSPGSFAAGSMATDGRNVYWMATDQEFAGQLLRVSVAGGQVTTLATGNLFGSLTLGEASAYWTTVPPSLPGLGTVMSVPLAGGTPSTLASAAANPVGITATGAQVYWSVFDRRNGGRIFGEPSTGGTATVFAALGGAGAGQMVGNATNLYWSEGLSNWQGTQMWTAVATAPLAGGTVTTLVSTANGSSQEVLPTIAVDDANVYYVLDRSGPQPSGIWKLPLNGAQPALVATYDASQGVTLSGMTLDATSLYWLETQGSQASVKMLTPK